MHMQRSGTSGHAQGSLWKPRRSDTTDSNRGVLDRLPPYPARTVFEDRREGHWTAYGCQPPGGYRQVGANQQPWTFVVVSDPDTKQQIREAAENTERDFYERRISPEWRDALAPLGTDHQKPHLSEAPYIVVVFEQPFGLEIDENGEEVRTKHYYAQESVGIAVGLFIASITAAGLCCLTHTPSPMIFLRDLLGRPRNERPFVVLPIGYPAEDATVPAHALQKKSLDEILIHVDAL
jgi:iodotyrosine deiodinase